jgi:uncharacterized OB-fold protein
MTDTHLEPAAAGITAPFWDAAARGELVLQRCDACRAFVWYPRAICPACGGGESTWTPASGVGTVYAVSVHHRAPRPELASLTPYAVALVDLDEGVRMMARVEGTRPEAVVVGQRVRWRPDPTGGRAFVFEPA